MMMKVLVFALGAVVGFLSHKVLELTAGREPPIQSEHKLEKEVRLDAAGGISDQHVFDLLRTEQLQNCPTFREDHRFMKLLIGAISSNNEFRRRSRGHPLFFIWYPNELQESSDSEWTILTFQTEETRGWVGDFTSVQIVFTAFPNATTPAATTSSAIFLEIQLEWEHSSSSSSPKPQSIQSQSLPIVVNKTFYSFAITEHVASSLVEESRRRRFSIRFRVTSRQTQKRRESSLGIFWRVFDIHRNRPLLVFLYGGTTLPTITTQDQFRSLTRQERSVGSSSRPSSHCRRVDFKGTPANFSWHNVHHPQVLDLGFCAGSCPYPLQDTYFNYTLNAFLLDRYRLNFGVEVPSGFPSSACKPVTFKPVDVIMMVNATLHLAVTIRDLSIASCGCR